MKKVVALLFFLIFTFCLVSAVNADSSKESPKKIVISFRVGDEFLIINNKYVQVQKPFVVNGVTLVPVRVITEAFGAEVDWNGEEKSVLLKYEDINIKLVIGSKKAVVNGVETTLLEAPVLQNGITMVPLRFISENFGADVTYIDETKEIKAVKIIASPHSVRDLRLILRRSEKERMGDSYYNWSISFPKELDLEYRNFKGSYYEFCAKDGSYTLSVTTGNLPDPLDYVQYSMRNGELKKYTILKEGMFRNEDGDEYVYFSWKDGSSACEYRAFNKNNVLFEVRLKVNDYNNYIGNDKFRKLMDSFRLVFPDDGTAEDLSDVDLKNYRIYQDKTLGWSFAFPAEVDAYPENKAGNYVFLTDTPYYILRNIQYEIEMYSIEEGMTLDKFFEKQIKEIKDYYNPEVFEILEQKDGTIGGVRSKELVIRKKQDGSTRIYKYFYIFGEKYRYVICYYMWESDYNNPDFRNKFEYAVKSFTFTEPDESETGKLTDPKFADRVSSFRKLSNDEYKWSFEIPSTWKPHPDTNWKTIVQYGGDKYGVRVDLYVLENITYDECVYNYENHEGIKASIENGGYKRIVEEEVHEKGATIKKYVTNQYDLIREYRYVISKNGLVYIFLITLPEDYVGPKNVEFLDKIWQSLSLD